MKKLAIYVEGQTEQIFVAKLIKEIANKNNLTIQLEKMHGGKASPRKAVSIAGISDQNEAQFYVLIRDCGGDSRIKSDIKDNIEKHSKNGFSKVIGLLDVYPMLKDDLKKLIMYSRTGIPTKHIPFSIIYAVMEIEAWFMCQTSHFNKISEELTTEMVEKHLGHSLEPNNIENINNPATVLNDIYQLVGIKYDKKLATVDSVVNKLDYEDIYIDLKESISSLSSLITDVDDFLVT